MINPLPYLPHLCRLCYRQLQAVILTREYDTSVRMAYHQSTAMTPPSLSLLLLAAAGRGNDTYVRNSLQNLVRITSYH
jgi:hypothetical protein